jgi:hypothetical protein
MVFIGIALFLFARPPSRITQEVTAKDPSATKTTTSSADTSNVVVALLTAGVGLIAFGVNGIRFSKIEALGVKADTGQTLSADASTAATNGPASIKETGDHIEVYLLRSSWHGLKVLRACLWASKGKRVLDLRQMCAVGQPMPYDYAFAYFVASVSANAFIGHANPETGIAIVSEVHATLQRLIDDVMEGNIRANPAFADARRDDLNALLAYLKAQPGA